MARSGVGNIQTEEIRVEREDKHRIVGEILFFLLLLLFFPQPTWHKKLAVLTLSVLDNSSTSSRRICHSEGRQCLTTTIAQPLACIAG